MHNRTIVLKVDFDVRQSYSFIPSTRHQRVMKGI